MPGKRRTTGIPVGSPPNLIAIGLIRELAGHRLTFFDWVALTMPTTVAMLAVCWGLLRWLYPEPPGSRSTTRLDRAMTPTSPGPWTHAQLSVAAVFGVAAALWMLPGAVAVATSPEAPAARWLEARLPESTVALGAAVALFSCPRVWTAAPRPLRGSAWRPSTGGRSCSSAAACHSDGSCSRRG
jgi:solute carrier family 13 (sodium-dependent dicarboxylate transporter), member 2/3/5